MHVRNVGPEIVDEPRDDTRDRRVPVSLFEGSRQTKRVVDANDSDAVAPLLTNRVFGASRIRVSRDDEHVVVEFTVERGGVSRSIEFAAALCSRREAMDDFEDLHRRSITPAGN